MTDNEDPGPSDAWIEGLIRSLRGLPPGEPVPAGLVASWRVHLRREVRRHADARSRGRDPGPPPRRRGTGGFTSGDVIMEMLASGEGQAAMALLAATPPILLAVADDAAALSCRVLMPSVRHEAAATYGYLVGKVGGRTWASWWGREQPRVVWRDGRTARGLRPCDLGVPATHRAAINAVSPRRAAEWQRRLDTRWGPEIESVLTEMDTAGREAAAASDPMRIWDPEPGPPRGLLPDAPPPPEQDPSLGRDRGRG